MQIVRNDANHQSVSNIFLVVYKVIMRLTVVNGEVLNTKLL